MKFVPDETQTAMFGAGCFWGVEEAFSKLNGVISTRVGYSGGSKSEPTYQQVCSGITGHAEVVQIEYDPQVISYLQLLDEFWKMHDPTTFGRQGQDVGAQYRSVIFTGNPEQEKLALDSRDKLAKSKVYKNPIVTEIVSAGPFYPAEEYHQKYFQKNPGKFCRVR